MPSLPTSIKGSIGGIAGPNGNSQKRNGPGMPINIAANDITFSGGYNQMRKFAGQGPNGSMQVGM